LAVAETYDPTVRNVLTLAFPYTVVPLSNLAMLPLTYAGVFVKYP